MIEHSAVSPDIFDDADADLVRAINASLEDDTQKAQLEQAIARSLESVTKSLTPNICGMCLALRCAAERATVAKLALLADVLKQHTGCRCKRCANETSLICFL